MDTVTICMWVSVVLGTFPVGMVTGLVGGASKVIPNYGMSAQIVPMFDKLISPWLGVPAPLGRMIIGLAEMGAGWGMMLGGWGTALGLIKDPNFLDLTNALLICAPVGLILIFAGSGLYHVCFGKSAAFQAFLAVASLIVLACRLQVTPVDTLMPVHQQLVWGFVGVCVVGAVLAVLLKIVRGKSTAEMRLEEEGNKSEPLLKANP